MQDASTGNQPDGFAYEYQSSFEMGEFYYKKIIPSPLDVEEPRFISLALDARARRFESCHPDRHK